MSASSEINARAAQWVERADRDDWTDEAQHELDEWLAQAPAHRIAYWRLKGAWNHTDLLGALKPAVAETGDISRRSVVLAGKIAAAFVFVILAGAFAAQLLQSPRDRVYTTPVGGHETVSFADGSRIELNTNTVLRARMTSDERVVWLEKGEAYFQVKHDTVHPFIVIADGHRITDLGTKFLVRTGENRLQVAVTQGRVWLDEANRQSQTQSAMLSAGEMATATSQTIAVTKDISRELSNALAWRKGLLIFKHTTLSAAAAEFNRYNRQKLVIADSAAGKLTIDGTFPTTDVAAFIDAAQTVFGLRIQNRGNHTVISR